MSFVLRIYFIGLMAFVPSQDGQQLTVLLVDARDGYFASDGTPIPVHQPLLLARAERCNGAACREQAQEVANLVFQGARRRDPAAALDRLAAALQGGGAWRLNDSDLSIVRGRAAGRQPVGLRIRGLEGSRGRSAGPMLPATVRERESFSWVAEIGKIDPAAARVDPDVLADIPQKGLITGRLTLDAGEIFTHRVVRVGAEVVPIEFRSLREHDLKVPYTQALADWVVAEIEVEGCEVELADRNFITGESRTIRLSPKNCDGGVVEVALMNVPLSIFNPPPRRPGNAPPDPGKHFELYYELAAIRPPNHLRPVPYAAASKGLLWSDLHPKSQNNSALLGAIGLGDPRGPLDQVICPVGQFLSPLQGGEPPGE